MYTAELPGLQVNLVREAKRRLDQCVALTTRAPSGGCREVRIGKPADEIVKMAQERNSDLIVMGTAGRTRLYRLMVGSVAERVVRTAKCPVLTVRQPDVSNAEKPAALAAAHP